MEPYQILRGVTQESVLSPVFFSIKMGKVMG